VPLALIFAILAQTFVFGYTLAMQRSDIANNSARLDEMTVSKQRQWDEMRAMADKANVGDQRVARVEAMIEQINRNVERLVDKLVEGQK